MLVFESIELQGPLNMKLIQHCSRIDDFERKRSACIIISGNQNALKCTGDRDDRSTPLVKIVCTGTKLNKTHAHHDKTNINSSIHPESKKNINFYGDASDGISWCFVHNNITDCIKSNGVLRYVMR